MLYFSCKIKYNLFTEKRPQLRKNEWQQGIDRGMTHALKARRCGETHRRIIPENDPQTKKLGEEHDSSKSCAKSFG